MLTMKSLENRVYSGKQLIGFDYTLRNDEKQRVFEARFRRDENDALVWNIQVVLDRTQFTDSQVYNIAYQLPKPGMNLELVAAIGLRYLQNVFKEEVQAKSMIDFMLGDVTKDM